MKIKNIHIKNFKSIVDVEINEPNPFSVFVGANGVGKSNIFEALEFSTVKFYGSSFYRAFGSKDDILSKTDTNDIVEIYFLYDESEEYKFKFDFGFKSGFRESASGQVEVTNQFKFLETFSKVFIGNRKEVKIAYKDDLKLLPDGSNLEKVLKRLLRDELIADEISEYLTLLVPGFSNVEVQSSELSGVDTLLVYEQGTDRPFTKNLISDGTYNILCLLAAVYQSNEPQFLCIEEPENGLTPYVLEVLVDLIRTKCSEKGHYVWLNTHSPTLVRLLNEQELILVEKVEGSTRLKQLKSGDFFGLNADEAWLTNALGAGLPW